MSREEDGAPLCGPSGTKADHLEAAEQHSTPVLPFPHRLVAAPMVGASDLAFRLLVRRHGAELVYTEMLLAERLVAEPEYRARKLQTDPADHPLVVQLAGSSAETLAAASVLAVGAGADAVCLNLGCPLPQALEGGFGHSLVASPSRWAEVGGLVEAMIRASHVPVLCKIRLAGCGAADVEGTVRLCEVLRRAGCSLVAVHARTLPAEGEHRADRFRAADLEALRRVVRGAAPLPVLCNGGTRGPRDVAANLRWTGAAGLMSAEALLSNPLLFEQAAAVEAAAAEAAAAEEEEEEEQHQPASQPPPWSAAPPARPSAHSLGRVALEYLDLAEAHPPPAFRCVTTV